MLLAGGGSQIADLQLEAGGGAIHAADAGSGLHRDWAEPGDLSEYDLILTTYGTLRKDAVHFRDLVFDYVILDEAQAVKNAKTVSAKAVRLLRGNHRWR